MPPFKLPLSRLLLAAAFVFFLASPAAARPDPPVTLAFSNGSQPIAQLLVGDDLYAALAGGPPERAVELRLLTADGIQLAAEMVVTDAAGATPPILLWVRTGVVGCDSCFPAEPGAWQFESYAQAEATLDRQLLTVEAVNPFDLQVLASATLPVAAPAREIAYFSGADGCPRWEFAAGKPIYLTLRHPDLALPQRRLFLPAAAAAWPLGQPIADARGSLQLIFVPPSLPAGAADQATFLVTGTASLPPGPYDGLSRFQVVDFPLVLHTDSLVASRNDCYGRNIRGGVMIILEDCPNCPPG